MTVAVSVLYPPTCDVSYSLEGEHVVLACTAEANPEDVTFMWTRKEELLPGQAESTVSLGLGNDSAGEGRMKEVKSGLFPQSQACTTVMSTTLWERAPAISSSLVSDVSCPGPYLVLFFSRDDDWRADRERGEADHHYPGGGWRHPAHLPCLLLLSPKTHPREQG